MASLMVELMQGPISVVSVGSTVQFLEMSKRMGIPPAERYWEKVRDVKDPGPTPPPPVKEIVCAGNDPVMVIPVPAMRLGVEVPVPPFRTDNGSAGNTFFTNAVDAQALELSPLGRVAQVVFWAKAGVASRRKRSSHLNIAVDHSEWVASGGG